MAWPLYVRLELRAMAKSQRIRESAVSDLLDHTVGEISCSGSPLMLVH
jgi:hypothetical protein